MWARVIGVKLPFGMWESLILIELSCLCSNTFQPSLCVCDVCDVSVFDVSMCEASVGAREIGVKKPFGV